MQDPLLFNADAPQRIPLELEKGGKTYKVAHLIGAVSDEDYLRYDRERKVNVSDTRHADEAAVEIKDDSFTAAVGLWNRNVNSIEGYGLKGGGTLDGYDWKSKVKDDEKAFAVLRAMLAVEASPLQSANEDEFYPLDDDEDTATVRLECLFEGRKVIVEHLLKSPNAEQLAKYRSIVSRRLIVKGTRFGKQDERVPSRVPSLSALYDELKVSASGYEGRVPNYHKVAVVLHCFSAEQEAVAGN